MQTQGEICVPDNEAVGLLSLPESHYISAIQLSSTQSWLLPLILLASQHKSTGADCSRQAVFRAEKSLKSHKVKCHPRIGAARPAHVFTILHCPRYSADLCSGFLNAPTLADSSKGATTLPVTDKFAVVLASVSRDRTLSHHHTCTEQAKLLFAIRSTGNDLVYLAVGLLFRLTLSLY